MNIVFHMHASPAPAQDTPPAWRRPPAPAGHYDPERAPPLREIYIPNTPTPRRRRSPTVH